MRQRRGEPGGQRDHGRGSVSTAWTGSTGPGEPRARHDQAGALRSIPRQDPDIVLVGEIRDKETADIAIKAALTGHLVLSTLHTNAAATITRLVDMGIDPFMVSSSILCICAQRPAPLHALPGAHRARRRSSCSRWASASRTSTRASALRARPRRLPALHCGYKGRFLILETLSMSPRLRGWSWRAEGPAQAQAIDEGMLTLRRVGISTPSAGSRPCPRSSVSPSTTEVAVPASAHASESPSGRIQVRSEGARRLDRRGDHPGGDQGRVVAELRRKPHHPAPRRGQRAKSPFWKGRRRRRQGTDARRSREEE